jgi:hypothetical protein
LRLPLFQLVKQTYLAFSSFFYRFVSVIRVRCPWCILYITVTPQKAKMYLLPMSTPRQSPFLPETGTTRECRIPANLFPFPPHIPYLPFGLPMARTAKTTSIPFVERTHDDRRWTSCIVSILLLGLTSYRSYHTAFVNLLHLRYRSGARDVGG